MHPHKATTACSFSEIVLRKGRATTGTSNHALKVILLLHD